MRRDGSSLFGPDERWQNYYRASAAWRMAEETWWPVSALDEFKPRYSGGTAGGRPNFADQYETYTVDQPGRSPRRKGNRELRPEHAREQEVGVDMIGLKPRVAAALLRQRGHPRPDHPAPAQGRDGVLLAWANAGP